jgi:chemotaxis protein methyltransferase CheR
MTLDFDPKLIEILKFFSKYIEAELGIIYSETNYYQLQNRLENIAKIEGYKNLFDLYKVSEKSISGNLKKLLIDLSTNNETSFFRDEKIFNAIKSLFKDHFLVDLLKQENLRIWSAASSSGQEAISVAITLNELSTLLGYVVNFEIKGTDISEKILEKAKSGLYTDLEVSRGMSENLLTKYFVKEKDFWKVRNEIFSKITYQILNLIDFVIPEKPYHIVLCRNVLIYQKVENKIAIIKKISRCIVSGGYFILGSGESLIGLSDDFNLFMIEGACIYRKK